jgi:hypothetical protein
VRAKQRDSLATFFNHHDSSSEEEKNWPVLMKATNPWITYRTRFLVKAKQLTASLTFTDVLGRQHSGRKGDYLVESCDGVLRIAPRQIFEDIYVPLLAREPSASVQPRQPHETLLPQQTRQRQTSVQVPLPVRKLPQPDRGPRPPATNLRSLYDEPGRA